MISKKIFTIYFLQLMSKNVSLNKLEWRIKYFENDNHKIHTLPLSYQCKMFVWNSSVIFQICGRGCLFAWVVITLELKLRACELTAVLPWLVLSIRAVIWHSQGLAGNIPKTDREIIRLNVDEMWLACVALWIPWKEIAKSLHVPYIIYHFYFTYSRADIRVVNYDRLGHHVF